MPVNTFVGLIFRTYTLDIHWHDKQCDTWAGIIDKDYGDCLGFVWNTKPPQENITVQEITGVKMGSMVNIEY